MSAYVCVCVCMSACLVRFRGVYLSMEARRRASLQGRVAGWREEGRGEEAWPSASEGIP